MLKIQGIKKTYRLKKGPAVEALKGINIEFPQKGMVFILGKSGSGKSTLLNILSGLDRADAGEISYGGKSFKNFTAGELDSYRNTYCGFIFQEYNLLPELNVEDNLALAIELQGRRPKEKEIAAALMAVDLEGYEKRRINELSGGEKQRVTIARGIIKNPKIIFADEPTGALDEATGRLILETLKRLSREKLVVVVSHDEEFAQEYGDRIIELADGRIAGDSGGKNENGKEMVQDIRYEAVKSRLPFKAAVKVGTSSFKQKPIRLLVTILLSAVAFTLFGISTALASFNKTDLIIKSFYDAKTDYMHFRKAPLAGSGEGEKFGADDIRSLKERLDICYLPVVDEEADLNQYFPDVTAVNNAYYADAVRGVTVLAEEEAGVFDIIGRLPQNNNEIAITQYLAEGLIASGFGGKTFFNDLIGQRLDIDGEKILCGIVDTGFDAERYRSLKNMPQDVDSSLKSELERVKTLGFHCLAFVNEISFDVSRPDSGYDAVIAVIKDKTYSAYRTLTALNGMIVNGGQYIGYNHIKFALDEISVVFQKIKKYASYLSIFFAVFSAVMLINFITQSIADKQTHLGIIRAMGARKMDVYKIFIIEGLVIFIVNYVIAAFAVSITGFFINRYFRAAYNLVVSVMSVSFLTLLIVFAFGLLVTLIGSIIPIGIKARKAPIEAIAGL